MATKIQNTKTPTKKQPSALTKEKTSAERLIKQALGTLQKVSFDIQNNKPCKETMQNLNSVIGMALKARKELFLHHCNECLPKEIKADKTKAVKELEMLYNKD